MAILNVDRPKKASLVKARLVIVIMGTLCPVICYMSRQNLSMAIVSMVNSNLPITDSDLARPTTNSSLQAPHISKLATGNSCPAPVVIGLDGKEESAPISITYGPRYDWSPSDRSLVFESFFVTYVVFQIPGARLAEVMGAKWILAGAAFGSAIISLLSPLAASFHVYMFALLRALMGICQTAIFPAGYVLYTKWLPPGERRRVLPLLGAGVYLGSVVATATTGYFSEQQAFGWPWAFYMPSLLCFFWGLAWVFLGASEPREHWFISLEEIDYIERNMEVKSANVGLDGQPIKKSPSWRKVFTSQSIWALMCTFFASNWAFTIVFLLLPSYLNDILNVSPFRNGLINSMIYILYIICSPIVGAVSSIMIETRALGFTRLRTRKFFQSVAVFSQAVCFISLPLIGCNTQVVLGLLYTQIVLFSFVNGGEVQLPSEISLDFAGTIYAIGNCVGSSTGFLVPRVHSLIVTNTHDRDQWNTYFYVAATVTTIGGFIFLIYGKNDLQDFSKDEDDKSLESASRLDKSTIAMEETTAKPVQRQISI